MIFGYAVVFFTGGQAGNLVDKQQAYCGAFEMVAVVLPYVVELVGGLILAFEFEQEGDVASAVLTDLVFVYFVVEFLVSRRLKVEVGVEHDG